MAEIDTNYMAGLPMYPNNSQNVYDQNLSAEKQSIMRHMIDNDPYIAEMQENFMGQYLRDQNGEVVFEHQEVFINGKKQSIPIRPIVIGQPSLRTRQGVYCEPAANVFIKWFRIALEKSNILTNFDADDIQRNHRYFCRGLIKEVGANAEKWDLDKSCFQGAFKTVSLKAYASMMRSLEGRQNAMFSKMASTQERVIVNQDSNLGQQQRGGLFGGYGNNR